jgi:hypothetical protein
MDNAEILMNEIDVKSQKMEDAKKAQERQGKIEEQEKRSNAIHVIRQKEIYANTAAAGQASHRLGS